MILLPGLVGNFLSFLVFRRPSLRQSVSSIFFQALAIFDTLFITSALTRYFVRGTFSIDFRDLNVIVCKLHMFILYVGRDSSSWTLCLISLERCIGVNMPLKAISIFTRTRAKIFLATIIFVVMGLNLYILESNDVKDASSGQICRSKYQHFHYNVQCLVLH